MNKKEYICIIIFLFSGILLGAIEYELTIEPVDYLQEGFLDKVQLRPGLWNGQALGLADRGHEKDEYTELILGFDADPRSEIQEGQFAYRVEKSGVYIQDTEQYRGSSAGMFIPGESLDLEAEAGSMFAPGSVWNDFSMEFWMYPVELHRNIEIFHWKGRALLGERHKIQQFTVRGNDGKVQWLFDNFFIQLFYDEEDRVQLQYESISLNSRREVVPRTWSHHLLRYDSRRGVLEYLIDGISEDVLYLSDSRREAGNAFLPYIGDESDGKFSIGARYHGFLDDFRIQRDWLEEPVRDKVENEPGYAIIGPINLEHARLTGFDALYRRPGNSDVLFSAMQSDVRSLRYEHIDFSEWEPLYPNADSGASSDNALLDGFGNYLYLRMDFLPDGSPDNIPLVQNVTLRYERDPPPPAPVKIIVQAEDDSIRINWDKVLGAEGYLLYYGDAPGSYFGRDSSSGTSPLDIGDVDEVLLEDLTRGKMYYFRIASYNAYNNPARGLYLDRRLSREVFARPRHVLYQ